MRGFLGTLALVALLGACSDEQPGLFAHCSSAANTCTEGVCICCDAAAGLCCDVARGICFDGDLSLTCRAADRCPYDAATGQACDSTTGRCIRPCAVDPATGYCCNVDAQVCRGLRRVTGTNPDGTPGPVSLRGDWCRPGEADCALRPACTTGDSARCMAACDPAGAGCPGDSPAGGPRRCAAFPAVGLALCTWDCTYDGDCGPVNCGSQAAVADGDRVCYPYFP